MPGLPCLRFSFFKFPATSFESKYYIISLQSSIKFEGYPFEDNAWKLSFTLIFFSLRKGDPIIDTTMYLVQASKSLILKNLLDPSLLVIGFFGLGSICRLILAEVFGSEWLTTSLIFCQANFIFQFLAEAFGVNRPCPLVYTQLATSGQNFL